MAELLIVEDEAAIAAALHIILTDAGHHARVVESGQAALASMQTDTPELIISDVMLRGMSGLQLFETVRDNPQWANIPFVFISASSTLKQRQQIAALERVAFLRKPFEVDTLLKCISKVLEETPGKQP